MKEALLRGVRTFLQTLAGCAAAFPTVTTVTDLNVVRDPLLLALWTATMSGLVAFLHNAAEALGGKKVP